MVKLDKTEGQFNYIFGFLNVVALFLLVWLIWYIFLEPSGVLMLYTPMYGFALVATLVTSILIIVDIAEFYPFSSRDTAQSRTGRGITLTVTVIALTAIIFYFFFWGFIGKFGIAYFSPHAIIAGGGPGSQYLVARENACTAIVYFLTAFIWITLFWKSGFGKWPWQDANAGTAAWSRFFAIFFFATILYAVLFHPHVCHLFYPAQIMAGVTPWWADIAGTGSAFFSLGIILCILFWQISFDLLWEGQPFRKMEKKGHSNFFKGIVVFISSVLLGLITIYILTQIMDHFWDEPFLGGQYTDGPDFRYIHGGEIAGFFILTAFLLKNYFNNFPNVAGVWVRGLMRTLITFIGGMLFYAFYYSPLSKPIFLSRVPGFGQPGDTPLVWVFLFISVIIIQVEFFEGWPLSRKSEK